MGTSTREWAYAPTDERGRVGDAVWGCPRAQHPVQRAVVILRARRPFQSAPARRASERLSPGAVDSRSAQSVDRRGERESEVRAIRRYTSRPACGRPAQFRAMQPVLRGRFLRYLEQDSCRVLRPASVPHSIQLAAASGRRSRGVQTQTTMASRYAAAFIGPSRALSRGPTTGEFGCRSLVQMRADPG